MVGSETARELRQDVILGLGFLLLAAASLKRLLTSTGQRGSETVITTFYSLILFTSVVRATWFLIPTEVLQPTYAPSTEYAFKGDWLGTYVSEVMLFVGSLSLFSIFILMAIFWADLLKGIFKESGRPSRPMASFMTVAAALAAAEGVNSCLFFMRVYSSQGMLMFESALLCMLSLVCSVEISRFSHRFRTVLRTLGAVNQISTDGQVTRIVRITVTGNVFFAIRAVCELAVGLTLYMHFKETHSFNMVFRSWVWDWYVVVKHVSEWMILFVMLWILHDPAEGGSSLGSDEGSQGLAAAEDPEYWEMPPEADGRNGCADDDTGEDATSQLTGNGRDPEAYGTL
ncbi:unnamed protein product [Ectocarpus sp. 12 AP-2014]